MVESYCVKGAPQEITLPGQKFDAPMKEAMGESLEELHHALEDGLSTRSDPCAKQLLYGKFEGFQCRRL